MAGSITVAVRKAVIEGLAAQFAGTDPDISVTYGWQGSDDTAAREQIFTNNARMEHSPAGMRAGRLYRDEAAEFDIVIAVLGVGMKPEETDERATELGTVVEEFIADRKSNTLGVDGLNWIRVSGVALDYLIAPQKGSISNYTITVRYEARLT